MIKIKLKTVTIFKASREQGFSGILEWLETQGGRFDDGHVIFEDEEAAIVFKLRYCANDIPPR